MSGTSCSTSSAHISEQKKLPLLEEGRILPVELPQEVILNSFIISNTPFRTVGWWSDGISKEKLVKSHVLFQKDDSATYIQTLLETAVK